MTNIQTRTLWVLPVTILDIVYLVWCIGGTSDNRRRRWSDFEQADRRRSQPRRFYPHPPCPPKAWVEREIGRVTEPRTERRRWVARYPQTLCLPAGWCKERCAPLPNEEFCSIPRSGNPETGTNQYYWKLNSIQFNSILFTDPKCMHDNHFSIFAIQLY